MKFDEKHLKISERQQLSILLVVFITSIKVMKIKSILKILLEEYNKFLKKKTISFYDIDNLVLKIMNEFKILSILAINNNSYEYEITTQTYYKFFI